MSNLLEFGGKANVILRAICDFDVNDYHYEKDDVVFCFEEVDVRFTYNEIIKDKTVAGHNLMAYDERKLNAMLISSTPLTTDFIELFATKTNDTFERPVIEKIAIADNKFYPSYIPSNEWIFITGVGQRTFTNEAIGNNESLLECTILSAEADELLTGEYQCIYDTKVNKPKFDINNNYTLPYFKVQIIGTGNVDKQTSYVYFEIPRVSLLTKPEYSMDRTITAQDLSFKIIGDRTDNKIEVGVY